MTGATNSSSSLRLGSVAHTAKAIEAQKLSSSVKEESVETAARSQSPSDVSLLRADRGVVERANSTLGFFPNSESKPLIKRSPSLSELPVNDKEDSQSLFGQAYSKVVRSITFKKPSVSTSTSVSQTSSSSESMRDVDSSFSVSTPSSRRSSVGSTSRYSFSSQSISSNILSDKSASSCQITTTSPLISEVEERINVCKAQLLFSKEQAQLPNTLKMLELAQKKVGNFERDAKIFEENTNNLIADKLLRLNHLAQDIDNLSNGHAEKLEVLKNKSIILNENLNIETKKFKEPRFLKIFRFLGISKFFRDEQKISSLETDIKKIEIEIEIENDVYSKKSKDYSSLKKSTIFTLHLGLNKLLSGFTREQYSASAYQNELDSELIEENLRQKYIVSTIMAERSQRTRLLDEAKQFEFRTEILEKQLEILEKQLKDLKSN